MNISLKCHLSKNSEGWKLTSPIHQVPIEHEKALGCLSKLKNLIQEDLKKDELQCFFKIEDNGIVYFLTAHCPEMIEYLAEKMINLSDIKIDPSLELLEDL